MKKLTTAATAMLTLALVIGPMGLSSSQAGVTWDVTITYELDDQGNVTSHSLSGVYSHTIDCSGDWVEISSGVSSALDDARVHRIKIDYTAGEVRMEKQSDGTLITATYGCTDSTSLELIGDSGTEWQTWERVATGRGFGCGMTRSDIEATAPSWTNISDIDDDAPEGSYREVCITARAGGPGHDTPYTGHVRSYVKKVEVCQLDDDLDRVCWTPEDSPKFEVDGCDMIYGAVWGNCGSNPTVEVVDPCWDNGNSVGDKWCDYEHVAVAELMGAFPFLPPTGQFGSHLEI